VPFGKTSKIGVIVARAARSDIPSERLRAIERAVDDIPPLNGAELALARFCACYYQRGIGEVLATGIPPRLRQVRRRKLESPVADSSGDGGFRAPHALTHDQSEAMRIVLEGFDRFHPLLLHGVTGSGQTGV